MAVLRRRKASEDTLLGGMAPTSLDDSPDSIYLSIRIDNKPYGDFGGQHSRVGLLYEVYAVVDYNLSRCRVLQELTTLSSQR